MESVKLLIAALAISAPGPITLTVDQQMMIGELIKQLAQQRDEAEARASHYYRQWQKERGKTCV